MTLINTDALLKLAIGAAIKAGEEILNIYQTNFSVETKQDNTPVTLADKSASACILNVLSSSNIPIISEEENLVNYEIRKTWNYVWLVDPLDGTKEFVKRNGEFATNIALVENGKPIIGVIYAPTLQTLYFSRVNFGSYKLHDTRLVSSLNITKVLENLLTHAQKLPVQKLPKNYTIVASRSHLSREVNDHINTLKNVYGIVDIINVGSSIKQCWVAEGKAHEYPRFGPTMEWDTAAGQCILEQCGHHLLDFETKQPLLYNKESMVNGYFVAK
jgi:3'(2'), 5'-bisphosphate nucleotidase